MSKKKNKGKKPEQNNTKKTEEIKASDIKEAVEEISEAEDISEESEAEETEEKAAKKPDSTKNEKKEDKKSDKKSDKKTGDKPASKKSSKITSERDEFLKLSFIEKCKKDPVIPIMLILVFVAVIVAAVYFILPNAKSPSMGMTLDDFKTRYNDGEVAAQLYANGMDIGINYTQYVDPSANPSILGDKETFKLDGSNVDYFTGDVSLMLSAGLEGATRRSDNELAMIRVYVKYEFEPTWMIFANTLQALYPDLTKFQALDIAIKEMNEYKGDGLYAERGDIAFRIIPVKILEGEEEVTYIVIEAVPKNAISAAQIGHVVETTASASETTAATEATTVASVAET